MKQFTAEQKHEILIEYQPCSPTHSFSALAARHAVPGGKMTINNWYHRWDGTIESLKHKKGGGRPSILTRAQVMRHIAPRIRSSNRHHVPIVYPRLLPAINAATSNSMSLRTLERYGKKILNAKPKHGQRRTADECEYTTQINLCFSVSNCYSCCYFLYDCICVIC